MKRKHLYWFAWFLPFFTFHFSLLALLACSGGGQQKAAAEADSTAVDEAPQPTLAELTLPDTLYASAQAVVYQVELDDSADATLQYYDDLYDRTDRVMTFRKNLRRDADFGGTVTGTPDTIDIAWTYRTPVDTAHTRFGQWGGGTGWTGQPLYARWTDAEMALFRQSPDLLTEHFGREEIMVGSLCGKAFFLNFETGQPSRRPLDLGNVVKGTMSLDPELMNLYVGQGVSKGQPLGCEAFDLTTQQRTFFFNDPHSWRKWQAFDSSPVVVGGYLFWPGENGSLYKYRRGSGGQLQRVAVMRYRVRGAAPGIESSLCVYRNYGFFSDNHGNIIAVNLNTMRPVWHYYNHDDSDGTIVCREEQGVPYLYAACEVDKQGHQGLCHFVKLRALSGECVWEQTIACNRVDLGAKTLDGGMYSTPLLGRGDCSEIIFANICRNGASESKGELTAFSTRDGSILFTVPYGEFCWSSPVSLLNERGEMFIFTAAATGFVYVIRGKTGQVLCQREIGYNVESSPVVVGNSIVVGARGQNIYKFTLR